MDKEKINRMFNVPEGYFGDLQDRLMEIPSRHPHPRMSGEAMHSLRPYIALAASFLIILAAGTAVLRLTTKEDQPLTVLERIQLADLMPVTSPDILLGMEDMEMHKELSKNDITDYLIESGTTLEQLEYYYEEDD
ncbi:MAG: hypothetical protein SOY98_02900 [Candidatus Cryptobacteroides sp.]|nr:hypothetical protein [Bacteroidales bacterium]MDY3963238.1 hypothetical protein [Candidatus Cryptobacteroides sp.]